MDGNAEFIAYCLEEYKSANNMTGKEVITLFKKKLRLYKYLLRSFAYHGRPCHYRGYFFPYQKYEAMAA